MLNPNDERQTHLQGLSRLEEARRRFNVNEKGLEISQKFPFSSWEAIKEILSFFKDYAIVGLDLDEDQAETATGVPEGDPKLWDILQTYAQKNNQTPVCAVVEKETGIVVYVSEEHKCAHQVKLF